MAKRPITFTYLFFYLLLSPDAWRIGFGFVCAVILGPMLTQGRGLNRAGEVMVWLMVMAIGWSFSGWPARRITGALQRAVKRASH